MSHLPPGFDPKYIQFFLRVQFCANLLVNFDMGILPAGSIKIKKELGLNNVWFGFLGSVVYGGQVLGSALASGLLQKWNPKYALSMCLFLNISTLLIFTQTDVYVLSAFCRFCTGLF